VIADGDVGQLAAGYELAERGELIQRERPQVDRLFVARAGRQAQHRLDTVRSLAQRQGDGLRLGRNVQGRA
jgi:hypothetical protein